MAMDMQLPGESKAGIEAFVGVAHSSRSGDASSIGEKGLGVKSYFLSTSGLLVVTKTTQDADWAWLHIPNALEWLQMGNTQVSKA